MIWRSIVNCLAIAATALLLAGAAQANEIADIKGARRPQGWHGREPALAIAQSGIG